MTILPIDELNTHSIAPKFYFGGMRLSDKQVDDRIRLTEDANEAVLYIMTLVCTMADYGLIDYDMVQRELETRLLAVLATYVTLDDYINAYVADYAKDFVESTQKNIDNPWYISEDRALYNAENTANDALNYGDYEEAIDAGYTHKKWLTENDAKVRDTHRKLNGKTIKIEDYFEVGDALMRFPKDYELAYDVPEELVNCRCVCRYLNHGGSLDDGVEKTAESGGR